MWWVSMFCMTLNDLPLLTWLTPRYRVVARSVFPLTQSRGSMFVGHFWLPVAPRAQVGSRQKSPFLMLSGNISGRAKYKAGVSLSGRSHGTVVRGGTTMCDIFWSKWILSLCLLKKQLWLYFPLHCKIQNQIHILWPVYSDTILPPWVVTTLTCCLKSPVLWTSPQRFRYRVILMKLKRVLSAFSHQQSLFRRREATTLPLSCGTVLSL